jgi:hypothetical protein
MFLVFVPSAPNAWALGKCQNNWPMQMIVRSQTNHVHFRLLPVSFSIERKGAQ